MTGTPQDQTNKFLPDTQRLPAEQATGKGAHREAAELPGRLGRYVVQKKLGQGGFADVFLARDEELDRQVALKLPLASQFGNDDELKTFIEEARTSARLQHPGIVKVFDVGNFDGTPFIVLEYIRGRSLSHLLKHESISIAAAVQMMIAIAEAIAHAHDLGFVHRDVKPQNILLDTDDRPHIADFGLAVRHQEFVSVDDSVAGTTYYMAPEQVRGETHRIDARTDIWAMGVVLYLMLTRRLPFNGSTRREIFQQILYADPVPPRQIVDSMPEELERICLRCLCRQMSDRYRRANDLAADLIEWLDLASGGSGSTLRRRFTRIEPPDAPVVPRGLRSFDQEDGDFFLRLIPGPRDRDGLPASIRFWKHNIEQRDCEETFKVGVLYGPSGCGKSSLVKAGLLPRLSADVDAIYIDATLRDTETRLRNALARRCRQDPSSTSLDHASRQLRESPDMRGQKKLLIVLDQFEQWLQSWQSGEDSELVRALRQCDGGNVQAILLVRDDFWLPVSRLMRQLEIGIVEGVNGMLVDSFDPDHAQRVLRELGVAYGRLPEVAADQSEEQTAFLAQAVEELTEENRLYPVRLAVFVEMVKDRPWDPEMLAEMGGAEGVGAAFLETSVGARASPARRMHENAIRRILAALLPPSGKIKGRVLTRSELLKASDCERRQQDFDAAIRILDVELRLITPSQTDKELRDAAVDERQDGAHEAAYQLTHDFLVPSIQEWLERQSRGSRKGRALLFLKEQSEMWNARPSGRYLPSLFEWIGVGLQTSRREWTEPQRRMMQAAGRRILRNVLTAALLAAIVLVLVLGGAHQWNRQRQISKAEELVSQLQAVNFADVPQVVEKMAPYRTWTDSKLHSQFNDPGASLAYRTRAALGLLPSDPNLAAPWLTERLMDERTAADEWLVIRDALSSQHAVAEDLLRSRFADTSTPPAVRFRIAAALAAVDMSAELWDAIGAEVVVSLFNEPAADARTWISALAPVGDQLRSPLVMTLQGIDSLETARTGTLALFEFGEGNVEDLVQVLVDANGPRYRAALEMLVKSESSESSLLAVRGQYDRLTAEDEQPLDADRHALALANAVLALWELGDAGPFREACSVRPDPRLRTNLIHGMTPQRIDLNKVLPLILDTEMDDPALNVSLLAASFNLDEPISAERSAQLRIRLREIYRQAADPELHAVAGLLMRKLGNDQLTQDDRDLAAQGRDNAARWFVTESGLTMTVLELSPAQAGPVTDRGDAAQNHRFAIAATEITRELCKRIDPAFEREVFLRVSSEQTPATMLHVGDIAVFCNRLSAREGIPRQEWCYPPSLLDVDAPEEIVWEDFYPVAGAMDKRGYRLPTAAEWELACGCGVNEERFYGKSAELLPYYAWEPTNSESKLQEVGQLLPNPNGLFDVYGNADEFCFLDLKTWMPPDAPTYVLKGGNGLKRTNPMTTRHSASLGDSPREDFWGFRVVRTLPPEDE